MTAGPPKRRARMASGGHTARTLGRPRLHLRVTTSTNDRARALAQGGAPHGTLVTAAAQHAGRGRQGRTWSAPPGRALLLSLVLHDPPALLPLAAALAVAEVAGPDAQIKWPNDVLVAGRKVAGILAEGRPHEGWAVLGHRRQRRAGGRRAAARAARHRGHPGPRARRPRADARAPAVRPGARAGARPVGAAGGLSRRATPCAATRSRGPRATGALRAWTARGGWWSTWPRAAGWR